MNRMTRQPAIPAPEGGWGIGSSLIGPLHGWTPPTSAASETSLPSLGPLFTAPEGGRLLHAVSCGAEGAMRVDVSNVSKRAFWPTVVLAFVRLAWPHGRQEAIQVESVPLKKSDGSRKSNVA
jgi:hypothetical protein